ncbi:glycosyltransferase involved in cell wall biosynthesis/ubiquinone/menaquinone biosynthesis C-methylase UbiE [Agrobacterium tumefaciens]|uniref:Glycosyltransferase involved in cell wall biosynthesis/ubiquinone/menaquinone biosynthesis C-methylase UbiE n=2 Tax=Agrobacterium tumefaciens TaxID=358 RepID=A0AAW8LXJ3_AGRTU|nr:glycosyltransferase [Agrobacterium tumefaciens]MBP2566437.1 glycosyltransferase involved in cell wall biosynthesis/ubiquinone/menaquinone biosynthesis C-methylase UbiE [Agrobacterium tumefaciens]MDR6703735.1 glycosyltransferase involved in cell wall biosynthesis/ubiquinone/menaquinone biosynthesis C-methylase UbiE [Agrobacterium tumefaciens]
MTEDLDFDGDRNLLVTRGDLHIKLMHRYYLAKDAVRGKDVLHMGSGDGAGTALLAEACRSVVGVDASGQAVLHAQEKYSAVNISFKVGLWEEIPLPSESVDVVVSFDRLGAVENPERLMQEIKRVLRPNGILIISTPEEKVDGAVGSVNSPIANEPSKEHFSDVLERNFNHVLMCGQMICCNSVVESESHATRCSEAEDTDSITNNDVTMRADFSGEFARDTKYFESLLKRVELEKAQWSETLMKDIDQISGQVDALQRSNWMSNASLGKLLKRLIYARLLYALSNVKAFGARRRKRFLKSAEKRDPMLLSRKVDQFCLDYYRKITTNKVIAESRSDIKARSGVTVTAIVPNFNHARYLTQRIDSILAQTYPLIDILVLDDCSSDDSRLIIDSYVKRFPERIKAIYNTENSGSVFRQWQKGHSQAKGDLVWICESDDFCEPTFIERTISTFRDPSVMLAFGRTQFVNGQGDYFAGLDQYREESEPGIWDARTVRPAAEWFRGGFGVKNVIANVGGSLWRRFDVPNEVWEEARSFKIMGDWYLYSVIAAGGQIAYEPSGVSYFRIHESNTSGKSAQSRPEYYREYARLMTNLKERWDIPDSTVERFIDRCRSVARGAGIHGADFDAQLSASALRAVSRKNIHVLIGMLGFSFGGGEIFPIHLANALRRKGIMVSMLQIHDADDRPEVRGMLDAGIPVYTVNAVRDMGIDNFIKNAGISIVHSHVANVEGFLFRREDISVPYIATLHGSYEAMDIGTNRIARWSKKIDRFAYTADRNLEPFNNLQLPRSKFLKIKNAMPVDSAAFPTTRAQLGIAEDAVVFSFVARGAEGKGWTEAVKAFQLLRQRKPDVPMALLMVGEGPETEVAKQLALSDPTIRFLGFVKEIHGLYRMSDVALIPTRFPGESYPLCLIQALQVGVPCVATDVGEIRAMSQSGDKLAGIIIANDSDNNRFVAELVSAMEHILDEDVREVLRSNAKVLGKYYDMDVLAGEYLEEYNSIIKSRVSAVVLK